MVQRIGRLPSKLEFRVRFLVGAHMKRKVSMWTAERIARQPSDFTVQTFRSGGNGGQNQNKRDTGVRIIDKETGLRAESREHTTQKANKRAAWLRLSNALVNHYEALRPIEDTKSDEVVRSYKVPSNTAVNHKDGTKHALDEVLDGDIPIVLDGS